MKERSWRLELRKTNGTGAPGGKGPSLTLAITGIALHRAVSGQGNYLVTRNGEGKFLVYLSEGNSSPTYCRPG